MSPTAVSIEFNGAINEDAEVTLGRIAGELGPFSEIHFVFARVSAVNSLGVRAWVNFMRSISSNRKITFHKCSPEIISQINMIPSFLGNAVINDFFVNYICPSCEHTESRLVSTNSLKPGEIPDNIECRKCGAEMETEELEDEYFAFLSRNS